MSEIKIVSVICNKKHEGKSVVEPPQKRMTWDDNPSVDIKDVTIQQKHLTIDQQQDLEKVLEKYSKLFDGTL